jgi:hypothetical protein
METKTHGPGTRRPADPPARRRVLFEWDALPTPVKVALAAAYALFVAVCVALAWAGFQLAYFVTHAH